MHLFRFSCCHQGDHASIFTILFNYLVSIIGWFASLLVGCSGVHWQENFVFQSLIYDNDGVIWWAPKLDTIVSNKLDCLSRIILSCDQWSNTDLIPISMRPSRLWLVNICFCYLSRSIPRYFAQLIWGIWRLLFVTEIYASLFKVNIHGRSFFMS